MKNSIYFLGGCLVTGAAGLFILEQVTNKPVFVDGLIFVRLYALYMCLLLLVLVGSSAPIMLLKNKKIRIVTFAMSMILIFLFLILVSDPVLHRLERKYSTYSIEDSI